MKNRALIALVTVVVAIFGSIALTNLRQELVPSITFPQLTIVTQYPGASPVVVNDDVSTPIEIAIQGIPGIESTTATSSTNRSLISATFTYGTDLGAAEQKISQAINRIKTTLPNDIDPQVITGNFDDIPVLQIAVASSGDINALAESLTTAVVRDIEDVDGVREARVIGAPGQRVTITPNQGQLAAAQLTAADIRAAIEQNGMLAPAGDITENGHTFAVQTGTKLNSVDDISRLPLVSSAPRGLRTIGDVARVELTNDPTTTISRVNGEPALTIAITKLPDANTVAVSRGVRDILPTLENAVAGNATFTVVFDQAPFIEQSIESLTTEGLLGLVFAILVILMFLLSFRSTIVTAISIPTSILITFIGLQAADYTLNVLTLGALTIAIGRVVDDSIVVIENIQRHLNARSLPASSARSNAERATTIVDAVREVAGAITASTITTVAVFVPIAFVEGISGELFRPFSLTVTIALLASLIVSLTIVPVLAYWFLRPRATKVARTAPEPPPAPEPQSPAEAGVSAVSALSAADVTRAESNDVTRVEPADVTRAESHSTVSVGNPASTEAGYAPVDGTRARRHRHAHAPVRDEGPPTRLQKGYLPIIRWALKHSVITLLAAIVVLGGTVALIPSMNTNFLGNSGQNTFTITQTLPVGASLDVQDTAAKIVEDKLRNVSGIEIVQLSIGSSGSSVRDAFSGGNSGAITYSVTTNPDANQTAVLDEVRSAVESLNDVGDVSLATSSGFGASTSIDVDVTAPGTTTLRTASDAILASLSTVSAVQQITSNLSESRPYVAVTIDRVKAAHVGLSEMTLGRIVAGAMQATTIGSLVIDDQTLSIYVQDENPPATIAALAALPIPTSRGAARLDTLATIAEVEGPATITTVKGLRSATISATPTGDNVGAASAQVQAAVTSTTLPAGVTATLGGVSADQSEAFAQLGWALLAAILIVYIVMVATFRSLLQPLLLLVSVPFAATGAIGLLVIANVPLGVASLIGVLMLIGIVVTNAIVLIDLVNQYRRRGLSVSEALELGAVRRLRPILMTALATIFALLPLAIGITGGGGGFISQPLALVVIGGLISSTALTLVVLPVLYKLVEGTRERRRTELNQPSNENEPNDAEPETTNKS